MARGRIRERREARAREASIKEADTEIITGDPKDRILEAAERIFAREGLESGLATLGDSRGWRKHCCRKSPLWLKSGFAARQ